MYIRLLHKDNVSIIINLYGYFIELNTLLTYNWVTAHSPNVGENFENGILIYYKNVEKGPAADKNVWKSPDPNNNSPDSYKLKYRIYLPLDNTTATILYYL